MKITPVELRHIEFKKAVRGEDPQEVKTCIESAADTLEVLIVEKNTLSQEVKKYKKLLQSQENIQLETQELMDRAKDEVNKMLKDAKIEQQQMLLKIKDLQAEYSDFITQFKFLLESYKTMLEKISTENKPSSQKG